VGIARLESGHLLVTNHGDGTLVELDEQGIPLERLDTGLGQGQLYGIVVRSDGRVYVAAGDGAGRIYRVNR
jgi:glucose/arabinose dehydrogenase